VKLGPTVDFAFANEVERTVAVWNRRVGGQFHKLTIPQNLLELQRRQTAARLEKAKEGPFPLVETSAGTLVVQEARADKGVEQEKDHIDKHGDVHYTVRYRHIVKAAIFGVSRE